MITSVVVRILWQQEQLELALQPLDVRRGGLGLRAREITIVARGIREHLLGQLEVVRARPELAGARDDGVELLVTPRQRGVLALVGKDVRIGQARLDIRELALQTGQALQHGCEARTASRPK